MWEMSGTHITQHTAFNFLSYFKKEAEMILERLWGNFAQSKPFCFPEDDIIMYLCIIIIVFML